MKILKIINDKGMRPVIAESWAMSWPMSIIMFFEFLIGLSDVYIAGKFGKEVQAGYGLAFQLYFVFIIAGMALTVGVASVLSRLFTSHRKNEFSLGISTAIITAGAIGTIATVFGAVFSKTIISYIHAPQIVRDLAVPLLTIYSFGIIFDYVLMCTNTVLRASDRIRMSLVTMTIVCLLNIALNFILAFLTPMGFKGIGVATVVSLFFGVILNFGFTKGLITKGFKFSIAVFRKMMDISWPSALLQVFWQLGAIALFLIVSFLPDLNIEIMAAFTNGLKIESAIFLPAFAFNMANAVLVGNSLGKKEKREAFNRGLITAATGVLIVFILTLIVVFNAKAIASRLSNDPIVIKETLRYIYIALLFEPIMAWGVIIGGGLNGAGDTKAVMAIVAGTVWLVRVPLSYIFGVYLGFGAQGIWWSMNISIALQCILMTMRYLNKNWMRYSEQVV
jgi:multidrug resistance protein, MATE family